MAYTRGNSSQIIVGAAALFVNELGPIIPADVPAYEAAKSYKDTLSADVDWRNVGYTTNGLELQFQPDFGEVRVDQILDVAKLYKQGMQVNLATAFAEATLENLLVAIAGKDTDLVAGELTLYSGQLGECPVERSIIAVGPGTGDCAESDTSERVYIAYRALSIENVTVSAKREEATMFEVSFRLLPDDSTAAYGKIVDRTWLPTS